MLTYHLLPTERLAMGSAQCDYNVSLNGFIYTALQIITHLASSSTSYQLPDWQARSQTWRSHRAETTVWVRLPFCRECPGKNLAEFRCLCCGTEVPISLCAVRQGPLLTPRSYLHSLSGGPSHPQSQQQSPVLRVSFVRKIPVS